MNKKDPYEVVKHLHVTEKTVVLENLKTAKSNPSVTKCQSPKYVFVVAQSANKADIAHAIKEIYPDVTVTAVNTINVKQKARRVRGRLGMKSGFKKAVVTFKAGDSIDNV